MSTRHDDAPTRLTGRQAVTRLLPVSSTAGLVRTSVLAAGLVVLALIPVVFDSTYLLLFLAVAFVYAAFAGGWAISSGFTGYLNLGYAMFVGLGAYTAANLDTRLGSPIWVTISVAAAVTLVYALIFGIATLRLRSHYVILATFAAVAAMESTAQTWRTYTSGDDGIAGVSLLGPPVTSYYWSFAFLLACGLALTLIARSRHGLILHAIRLNEDTARAAGVNTVRYRLGVFTLAGVIGGAGGAMLVHTLSYAGINTISLDLSLTVLVYGIVGGRTTVLGPMIAAILLVSAGEYLREHGDFRALMEAMILVVAIRFMPEGAGPAVVRATDRLLNGRSSSPPELDPTAQGETVR